MPQSRRSFFASAIATAAATNLPRSLQAQFLSAPRHGLPGTLNERYAKLDAIRPHLCSSLLADICKDRGLKVLLPPQFKRISGRSVLGIAKTLELRKLKKGDDWKGIYTALDTYNFIRPGDVIVVKNDVKDKAYFGDLNANIAVRSGAIGAVVDSYTRDSAELNGLEFSVFAHGINSRREIAGFGLTLGGEVHGRRGLADAALDAVRGEDLHAPIPSSRSRSASCVAGLS